MNGPVLRDIHVPPAGWWPPAPGWWLLAGIAAAVALAAWAWFAWRRRGAALRAALCEIDSLAVAFARDADSAALADGASRLLRRVALRIDPGVAAHFGAEWRAFVHRYARDHATQRQLDALSEARFRARPAIDGPVLLVALRAWCGRALTRAAVAHSLIPPHPGPLPRGERGTSARRFAPQPLHAGESENIGRRVAPPLPAGERATSAQNRATPVGTGTVVDRGTDARTPL